MVAEATRNVVSDGGQATALKATRRAVDAAEQAWLRWNPIVDADTLEAQDETVKRISMMKKRSGIAGLIDVALANTMVEVAKVRAHRGRVR